MYAKFQKELYNREVYYDDTGFITYSCLADGGLYLHNLFIEPSARLNKAGSKLTDKVIELVKPTCIVSYVDVTTANYNDSIKAHLAYGMNIIKTNETSITFYKDLK